MSARDETLRVPERIRDAVDERDGGFCRVCGRFLGEDRAQHHIWYGGTDRGMGGRREHTVEGIITVCWGIKGDCHTMVHADKRRWQPILDELTRRTGVTGLQLLRWQARSRSAVPEPR